MSLRIRNPYGKFLSEDFHSVCGGITHRRDTRSSRMHKRTRVAHHSRSCVCSRAGTVSGPSAFVDGDWGTMSATCYFSGRGLYKALGGEVPIGLVASDWGGTRVEAWSSPDALAKCPGAEEADATVEASAAAILFNDPPPDPNTASALYNGMIAPILPLRFKLATWYQGQSNAADPTGHVQIPCDDQRLAREVHL
jgi:hypothetical protein